MRQSAVAPERTRAVLRKACERALVASARGAASRQQLRAAARSFVRRHRHDHGYLRWVLRSVGASSALAIALLGLAEPVRAELAPFSPIAIGNGNLQDIGG